MIANEKNMGITIITDSKTIRQTSRGISSKYFIFEGISDDVMFVVVLSTGLIVGRQYQWDTCSVSENNVTSAWHTSFAVSLRRNTHPLLRAM